MKQVSKKLFAIIASVLMVCTLFAFTACTDDPVDSTDPVYTVEISGTGVTNGAISLEKDAELQLTATVKKDGTADSKLSVAWSSDKAETATVSESGLVKAVAAGTAKITAKYQSVSATVNVTVTESAPVVETVTMTGTGHVFSNDPDNPTDETKWSYPEVAVNFTVNMNDNTAVLKVSQDMGGGFMVDYIGDGTAAFTGVNIGTGTITGGDTTGTYKATFQITMEGADPVPYVVDFTIDEDGVYTASVAFTGVLTDTSGNAATVIVRSEPLKSVIMTGTGHVFSNDPDNPTDETKWSYPEVSVTFNVNFETNVAILKVSQDMGGGFMVDYIGDGTAAFTGVNIGTGTITVGDTTGTYKATFQITMEGADPVPYVVDFTVENYVCTATISFTGVLVDASGNEASVNVTSAAE